MLIPVTSQQDVAVHWPARLAGATAEIAVVARVVPEVEPDDGDYQAATWVVGSAGTATIPVGPGTDLDLVAGEYVIWGRVTDGDRRPVHRAGTLTVGPPVTP